MPTTSSTCRRGRTLNEQNKEEGVSPEKVEEGDTYALLDRNCFTEAFIRKVFVLVVDDWSYIFDEFGKIIDDAAMDAANFTPGGQMPTEHISP